MEEADRIKDLVNRVLVIERVAKMYREMLNKINKINGDLDKEHKVSTDHINMIIAEYDILITDKKKAINLSVRRLENYLNTER